MNGPYGLHHIEFQRRLPATHPLEINGYDMHAEEGVWHVWLEITAGPRAAWLEYVGAYCRCDAGDTTTLEAAKQWLLDLANARYT